MKESTIGIVGAAGKMGFWFSEALKRTGTQLFCYDPRLNNGITLVSLIQNSEIILVTTPLSVTPSVLQELSKYVSCEQLVGDISSVKAPVASALQALPCEIVSLHPLFGPRALTLSGRSIVWSQVSLCGKYSSFLRGLLTSQGASLIDLNLDEHDQMMSVVQVTTHLHLLLFGRILADSSPSSIEKTLSCATPPFAALASFTSRMLSQDAELYADIAGANPHTREILGKLKDLITLLIETDTPANLKKAFLEMYQPLKPFWTDLAIKVGSEKSDKIDELLKS